MSSRNHVGRRMNLLAAVAATLSTVAVATAASHAPPQPRGRPSLTRQPPPPNVVPAARPQLLQPRRDVGSNSSLAFDGGLGAIRHAPGLLGLSNGRALAAGGIGLGAGSTAVEPARLNRSPFASPPPGTYAPSTNMAQPSWSTNPSGRNSLPMTGVTSAGEDVARVMRAAPAAGVSGPDAGSTAAERARVSPSPFASPPRTYAPSANMAQPSWSTNPSGRSPLPMTGVASAADDMARAMRAAPAVAFADDAARVAGAGALGVADDATRGRGTLLGLGAGAIGIAGAAILIKKR